MKLQLKGVSVKPNNRPNFFFVYQLNASKFAIQYNGHPVLNLPDSVVIKYTTNWNNITETKFSRGALFVNPGLLLVKRQWFSCMVDNLFVIIRYINVAVCEIFSIIVLQSMGKTLSCKKLQIYNIFYLRFRWTNLWRCGCFSIG